MAKDPHKVLQDYVGFEGRDPRPTLHDLLQDDEPPLEARRAPEDMVWSSTPGNEKREGHVFPPSTDGIPYIHTDYAELRRLFNDPVTSEKERQLIVDAMRLLGVPRRDAPTDVRDEDFNYPNPNAPQGNSVRKADPWSR